MWNYPQIPLGVALSETYSVVRVKQMTVMLRKVKHMKVKHIKKGAAIARSSLFTSAMLQYVAARA